jgi:hypothetical protein
MRVATWCADRIVHADDAIVVPPSRPRERLMRTTLLAGRRWRRTVLLLCGWYSQML